MAVAAVCIAGDTRRDSEFMRKWRREQDRHKKLGAQPTPQQWRSGAVWRFITTPPHGKSRADTLAFRVTDIPANSCLGDADWKNVWRKFEPIEGGIPNQPAIYQVEGRALQINVTGEICDVYDVIGGVLTDGTFEGKRTTSGLGVPSKFVGTVRGSFVQQ